ncbi:MAG: carbohydrate kinase [Candidatus Omnitrophica bacterium]|nr:carbohydrate kinase [Candidatus Omnitrophota bacterium]MBU1128026.1 carbohydrate kinase [Candidatus Omnitrophota bacterium]MBU1657232.1 carbohydrate kinase [Candidatus Omnitrophota bacterium]MBU1784524.1 carbohydrate kinase [Candidatus Omnitrophota bacterium]MBU1851122.1 carbohydrate kinase [Candidatus Omnitrophota bacterium]
MNKRVFCCGNIAFDLVAGNRDVTNGFDFYARPGGSACNTAVLLARLGIPVSMISKTGSDFLSNSLLETLQKEGAGSKYVIRSPHIKTSLAFARIDKKGDSSYVFYTPRGRASALKRTGLPEHVFSKMSVFHASSIFSYDNYNAGAVLSHIKKANAKGVFVSYDPNWRGYRISNKHVARKRIQAILPHVDLLKLSTQDAMGITGCRSLSGAANRILDLLKGELVMTQGANGSFYWDGKHMVFHPAFKVRIKDTIGAGDGFTAGLLYRYLTAGTKKFLADKEENLAFASAVSALVATGKEATEGLKNLTQVRQFLSSNRRTFCKYIRPSL